MSKPILFDSFGYLLIAFRKGTFVGDAPNHVYHFGTMKKGITDPDSRYSENYKVSQEDINMILGWLKVAEDEGRLHWRTCENITNPQEIERFQTTLGALRRLGASIPEWNPLACRGAPNAFWNVPAMREFLGDSVEYANSI